jgi:NAD(P)-dependent dehydrogenase (short-subunit alcohol dehydrogenase family)
MDVTPPGFGVVTGAASGIGQAVMAELRSLGHDVLGIDRAPGDGIQAVDLSRPDAGDAVLAATDGRDATFLVNAAAVFHNAPLADTDAAAWDRLYAVNLRAPALLARALAPGLARTGGCIVNVTSINAQRNAPQNLVYDSLKAALDHMTRGLALDLAAQGVRVNAVAPGGTVTPGLMQWLDRVTPEGQGPDVTGLATPEDIARIIAFLIGPKSRWINGAVIIADNAAHLMR